MIHDIKIRNKFSACTFVQAEFLIIPIIYKYYCAIINYGTMHFEREGNA